MKRVIDNPDHFIKAQAYAFKTADALPAASRAPFPTNYDLARVIRRFKGGVYMLHDTIGGPYTMKIVKQAFIRELEITNHLRCDFSIFAQCELKSELILQNVKPPEGL